MKMKMTFGNRDVCIEIFKRGSSFISIELNKKGKNNNN